MTHNDLHTAGGTGSVGSLLALWLAEHVGVHVILLGRSGRHPADSRIATYRCVRPCLTCVATMMLQHSVETPRLPVRQAALHQLGRVVYASHRGRAMVTTVRGDAALAAEASAALVAAGNLAKCPLTAVVHAGAVLDPAVLSNVTFRSVRTEYSGKVRLPPAVRPMPPSLRHRRGIHKHHHAPDIFLSGDRHP